MALQAAPGAYALLLGSGLSSAAGVPTGWGITLDLLRHIAPAEHAASAASLEAWYREHHHADPDYSALLQAVAPTPAERTTRLRSYFTPTEEERAEGVKVPTRAHRAIAQLVASGHVRVILTTNFDQLLETALRDAGVTPAVISSAEGVAGAMPLQHAGVTVIKLHGDYTDTRLKNTADELSVYDAAIDRLLDRVLDEYGLIVCGWSATWDPALRAAIMRAPNRRFTTFWAQHGAPSQEATTLIAQRAATVIPITHADQFFERVAERVTSLEELRRPHPTSQSVAVASLKRYLPRVEDRIRLEDLVMAEVDRVLGGVLESFPPGDPTAEALSTAVARLGVLSETLMVLAANGAHWWETRHAPLWQRALERLGSVTVPSGRPRHTWWLELLRYPAQLVWYAAGVVACADRNDDAVASLLLAPQFGTDRYGRQSAAHALNYALVVSQSTAKELPDYKRNVMPWSDHLFATLEPIVAPFMSHERAYLDAFQRFEILAALGFVHGTGKTDPNLVYFPVGRAWYLRERADPRSNAQIDRIGAEIAAADANWFLLRHGLFGGSLELLQAMYTALDTKTQGSLW